MKYKYIKFSFLAVLLAGLYIRFKQLTEVTEAKTGFFIVGREKAGLFYAFILFLVIIVFCTCAALVNRSPQKTPKVTKILGAISIFTGVSILIEAITYITQVSMFAWEKLLLGLTGPIAAIFFVLYGIKGFKNYKLPRPLYAVPILYYLARFVCEFISVSKTALIFQNILNLAAIALVLIFMLEWGKIANNIAGNLSYKTILISGGAAALVCEFASLPELAFLFLRRGSAVAHQNPISLINLAVMGAFIAFYLYRHFKNSNLQRKRHSSKAITLKDTDGTRYYVGDKPLEK